MHMPPATPQLSPASGVPSAVPLPDDPTIGDDGRVALTPLLMRHPLPAASSGLPPSEWARVRGRLRAAARA
eukprot:205686-Chlamydomonas_euryale.AAC.1